jgi:hypothetical protein
MKTKYDDKRLLQLRWETYRLRYLEKMSFEDIENEAKKRHATDKSLSDWDGLAPLKADNLNSRANQFLEEIIFGENPEYEAFARKQLKLKSEEPIVGLAERFAELPRNKNKWNRYLRSPNYRIRRNFASPLAIAQTEFKLVPETVNSEAIMRKLKSIVSLCGDGTLRPDLACQAAREILNGGANL